MRNCISYVLLLLKTSGNIKPTGANTAKHVPLLPQPIQSLTLNPSHTVLIVFKPVLITSSDPHLGTSMCYSKNCSKERPGSIVTKTLKNGILILIDTSKELDFYDDFKCISSIKFALTHQKLRT